MAADYNYFFNLLKKAVASTFLEGHSASDSIQHWKGEDIARFQEDLFVKVKAQVSEKWFYTYFKNDASKLPRIDMLNLLSEYVGHKNWNTFVEFHRSTEQNEAANKKVTYWFALLLPIIAVLWFVLKSTNEFRFCFVDDIHNEAIVNIPLDIKILNQNESPIYVKTDSLGCFSYNSTEDYITFVVQSPYHKTDTIVRLIESNKNNNVRLSTDDYALMLHYYTDGNVKDWKLHKTRLLNLISDDALIYQLHGNTIGVEVFSKDEFVRMLTIPTSSLKRIKIVDKNVQNGKITKLKFIVL